jgi:hypothetical protein
LMVSLYSIDFLFRKLIQGMHSVWLPLFLWLYRQISSIQSCIMRLGGLLSEIILSMTSAHCSLTR